MTRVKFILFIQLFENYSFRFDEKSILAHTNERCGK